MARYDLENINTTYEGYQKLIDLYQKYKHRENEQLELNLKTWFSGNLCAALGGVLDLLKDEMITINFSDIDDDIKKILRKNGFLSHYLYPTYIDIYKTTIRYMKLKPRDGRYFFDYIQNELLNHSDLPQMSTVLKMKISESIYEIFTNAQIHSETKNIYACGQYFPHKHIIEFTITDTGRGFKEIISSFFNKDVRADLAIKWAFENTHSTKKSVSGGIGLSILKEFIDLNKGKILVVSDMGYYKIAPEGDEMGLFRGSFPGSAINVQFRTDDTKSYSLAGEPGLDDLF